MSKKDPLKELETSIKKIDPNLSIWVMMRVINKFGSLIFKRKFKSRDVFYKTLSIIEKCENIDNIKDEVLLLFSYLEIDTKDKKTYLNIIFLEKPESNLTRILKVINNDKRLSDFIYYYLRPVPPITNRINKKIKPDDLIAKNTIFDSNELIQTYSNNTPLLANLFLTDLFFRRVDYENTFSTHFKEFMNIKNKSKTIIERNLKKEGFSEWLFNYIEKNIIHGEMTQNTDYSPYTPEEKTNFMLHQLDLWYLLDEERYDETLKKIQSAWNKKTHDARKRASKL